MKTYIFKARRKQDPDIHFTIADLLPIPHRRHYSFVEISEFCDYSKFRADWYNLMDEEYNSLYQIPGNAGINFFKIKGQDLIVIPGEIIHPTKLTEQDIKDLDSYRRSVKR